MELFIQKKDLVNYAKETPASELKRVINESHDEKLRQAAHAELDRRDKNEKPQDKDKLIEKKNDKSKKEKGERASQWYDKYKKYDLNKYPIGIKEEGVQANEDGDIDSHWVLSWRDKSGKVQYGYTKKFMERNADKKWQRTSTLDENKIDTIKKLSAKGLTSDDPKVKQAAAVIGIIANTGLRVGSRSAFSVTENRGVTTLAPDNIQINGDEISFKFKGKSHKENVSSFNDKEIAKCLSELKQNAVKEKSDFIFMDIDRPDVDRIFKNNFGGAGMKIKDMRTYMAVSSSKDYLYSISKDFNLTGDQKKDEKLIAKKFNELYQFVSKILNNTPTMAKQSYINPAIRMKWLEDIGYTGDKDIFKSQLIDNQ
jgi:DNA topoisomerase-1